MIVHVTSHAVLLNMVRATQSIWTRARSLTIHDHYVFHFQSLREQIRQAAYIEPQDFQIVGVPFVSTGVFIGTFVVMQRAIAEPNCRLT